MRLIEEGKFWDNFNNEIEMGVTDIAEAVNNALENTPTVEAVPVVHARWEMVIERKFDGVSECYRTGKLIPMCTHCRNARAEFKTYFQHCPECGAVMDEGRPENGQSGSE